MAIGRILLPLDGSVLAEAAIPKVLEFADRERSAVILLRSVGTDSLLGADPGDTGEAEMREAEHYLDAVAQRLAREGFKHVARSVWFGPADDAIIEAARLMSPDLIVMGTHGRSGLGRFVLGSVAESVLRGTATAILFVRTPQAPLAPHEPGRARPSGGAVPGAPSA